jgi:hypothetical protein
VLDRSSTKKRQPVVLPFFCLYRGFLRG